MARSPLVGIILEKLSEAGELTLEKFFSDRPHAILWYPMVRSGRRRKITRHDFSLALSRLQRQGLVERRGTPRKSFWRLTEKGESHRVGQKEKYEERKRDGIVRLVIFDIPEYERKKRTAVRAELIACKFRQLQKSVWIGEYPLPKAFIETIDNLNLNDRVHIFSIREKGTIGKNL